MMNDGIVCILGEAKPVSSLISPSPVIPHHLLPASLAIVLDVFSARLFVLGDKESPRVVCQILTKLRDLDAKTVD